MKKIYTFFMVIAIAFTTKAQLVINENFTGYTNGNLSNQGNWVTTSGSPDVQVASTTPLTYTGYNAGGPYITVSSNIGKDPHKKFSTTVSTASTTTFYWSFLVRVPFANTSNNSPVYSIALYDTVSGSNIGRPVRFYINPGSSTHPRFGIATGLLGNSATYTSPSSNFNYATTYLIVIRYDVKPGSNNDVAYLWVNPSLPAEPSTASANVTITNSNSYQETNFGNLLTAMEVSQTDNTNSPDASYDAFLVAANATSSVAWALITAGASSLPVTLTGFNASQDGLNNTRLVWNVADENGIQSYVVEKSSDGKNYTDIGTVAASNQSSYSFTDVQANSDNTYYRLKMVEQDGSFKLSYILTLKSKLSASLSLSPNPVRSTLIIQHPKVTGEAHLQVINTSGQLVRDFRLPASAVISNVDMSGLANGMYHVVFRSGSDVVTKMVLKQ